MQDENLNLAPVHETTIVPDVGEVIQGALETVGMSYTKTGINPTFSKDYVYGGTTVTWRETDNNRGVYELTADVAEKIFTGNQTEMANWARSSRIAPRQFRIEQLSPEGKRVRRPEQLPVLLLSPAHPGTPNSIAHDDWLTMNFNGFKFKHQAGDEANQQLSEANIGNVSNTLASLAKKFNPPPQPAA